MEAKPSSIVIVENQPLLLGMLAKVAQAAGMKVLAEVPDSKNALERVSSLTPDLVLFSVSVPSLMDYERITVLKQHIPGTKILALVTGEFREQEQAALDHGADKVLTKAASRWELIETLKGMSSTFSDRTVYASVD